jgi:hypothetical protein
VTASAVTDDTPVLAQHAYQRRHGGDAARVRVHPRPAAIREFIRADVSPQRWQHRATRANGQPAIGGYIRAASRAAYEPWVLDAATLDGGQIAGVHPFNRR